MTKIMLSVLLLASPLSAHDIDKSLFGAYYAALIIHNRAGGHVENVDPKLAARSFPPCSTFKIVNTLIGLELGLLKSADAPWYTWDGVQRDIEGWNQDLTLREAFRVSAVPAYQELARKIGGKRMKRFIDRTGYGNRDMSSGLDIFWLPRPGKTPLLITAEEQVALLNKLLDGKLPFSRKSVDILRDVMKVAETEKGVLYGKTGTGMRADGGSDLGWLVGFLESNGSTYVFACNITGGESPSGKAARAIVENVFRAQGRL